MQAVRDYEVLIFTDGRDQECFNIPLVDGSSAEMFVISCFGSADKTRGITKINVCEQKRTRDGVANIEPFPEFITLRQNCFHFSGTDVDAARWGKFRDEYVALWLERFECRPIDLAEELKFKGEFFVIWYNKQATQLAAS